MSGREQAHSNLRGKMRCPWLAKEKGAPFALDDERQCIRRYRHKDDCNFGKEKATWQQIADASQDWRISTSQYRMSSKLSAGMPDPMKEAVRRKSKELGISMSELMRRLIAKEGIQ